MMSDDEDSDKGEDGKEDDGKRAIEEQLFDKDGEQEDEAVRQVEETVQQFDSEKESDNFNEPMENQEERLKSILRNLDEGKPVNTLELGLLATQCQGPYESEISFEGEAGFLHNYRHCKKNGKHEMFIPIRKFITCDHTCLPEGFKEPKMFNFIKLQAALTVKIKNGYVCKSRPDCHLHTRDSYMGGEMRGYKFCLNGTGMVIEVEQQKSDNEKPCLCRECGQSGVSRTDWTTLTIMTACHVVYNQLEANKTKVEFLYFTDEGKEKTKLISNIHHRKINADTCHLSITTHDEDFVREIKSFLSQLRRLWYDVRVMLSTEDEENPFLPIVSHPHGLDKQVSFGFTRNPIQRIPACSGLRPHNFEYDTPTCGGSSGAIILVHLVDEYWPPLYTHEGTDTDKQINYSGACSKQLAFDPFEPWCSTPNEKSTTFHYLTSQSVKGD